MTPITMLLGIPPQTVVTPESAIRTWVRNERVFTTPSPGSLAVGDYVEFFYNNRNAGYGYVKAALSGNRFIFDVVNGDGIRIGKVSTGEVLTGTSAYSIVDLSDNVFSETVPPIAAFFTGPFGVDYSSIPFASNEQIDVPLGVTKVREVRFWAYIEATGGSRVATGYNSGELYSCWDLIKGYTLTSPYRTFFRLTVRPTVANIPAIYTDFSFTGPELSIWHHFRLLFPDESPPELWVDNVKQITLDASAIIRPANDAHVCIGAAPVSGGAAQGGFRINDFQLLEEIDDTFVLPTQKQWP